MNCLANRKRFKKKHPVWSDPTDKHEKQPEPNLEEDDPNAENASSSSDEDDELFANDVKSKKVSLDSTQISYEHLVNINHQRSFNGAVQQVRFHPKSKISLVSLSSGQADLFEMDGEVNRYIQNIKIPRTSRPYCNFTPGGESVITTAECYKGVFYVYDMTTGKIATYTPNVSNKSQPLTDFVLHGDYMACRKESSADVSIISSKTYENISSLKLNEPAQAIQFTADDNVYILGLNSSVYIWDLRNLSTCKWRFRDDGTLSTKSLALSDNANMLSIGSNMGIVNTYHLDKCLVEKNPKPIKTYSNLTRSIDLLKYNPTGELLLMGSSEENFGMRLAHSLSGRVYRNFPEERKKYGRIFNAEFSPLGGYLGLASSLGRAFLCRLLYYPSY